MQLLIHTQISMLYYLLLKHELVITSHIVMYVVKYLYHNLK